MIRAGSLTRSAHSRIITGKARPAEPDHNDAKRKRDGSSSAVGMGGAGGVGNDSGPVGLVCVMANEG